KGGQGRLVDHERWFFTQEIAKARRAVIEPDRLEREAGLVKDRAVIGARHRIMPDGKSLVATETGGGNTLVVDVVDQPVAFQRGRVIPQKPLQPVLQDARRLRRAPDSVAAGGTFQVDAQELIEAGQVIDVEMAEAEM